MRQVFSSPRIENVEAVARMLGDAGIEVRVTNGRSYRGAIRGNFSYRDQGGGGPRPAVWVIRSDQQPEARRLLREAGLLQSPSRADSFLASAATPSAGDAAPAPPTRGGNRVRYGLLLGVAVVAALALLSWRGGKDEAADAAAPLPTARVPDAAPGVVVDGVPEITTLPDEAFRVPTPPALASTLLREALASAGSTRGCLRIDGHDPDPALLQELAGAGLDVVAASACDGDRLEVAVAAYTTDGSGAGTVEMAVGGDAPRVLEVRREGREWRIAEPVTSPRP